MVQGALRKAERIIEREQMIRLSTRDAERFFQALEMPRTTKCSIGALRRHKDATLDAESTIFDWRSRPKRV
uniref:DUF1778 domain-containing protein n=1 Tax=Candidatus Kentrum sp. TUN TaxID=2126343 RepID=A0A451A0Y1_9GAMM|nr:MAG: Protein of unknown function (DUF1778) [Candidatus Kentron sp. TUN]